MTQSANRFHVGIASKMLNFAFSIALLITSQHAWTQGGSVAYKWKDEKGMTHFSDKPPPQACTSADCKQFFDSAKEIANKKKQDLERAKVEKTLFELQKSKSKIENEKFRATLIESAKQQIRICLGGNSNCTHSMFQEKFQLIGPQGVKEILGEPQRIQKISVRYGYNIYWYYKIVGQLYQFKVDEEETIFFSINIY